MKAVEYDVVVIGAGPAGSFAAMYAAGAGRRVLLVDRNTFPRDKVCGDGLNPRSCFILAEAGIDARRLEAAGAARVRGYRKFRGGAVVEERIVPRAGWADHAYGLPRQKLDGLLRDEALAAGAEWRGGYCVKEIAVDASNQQVTVRGEQPNGPADVGARIAIIASGASAAYYRKLGSAPDRLQGAIAGGLRQYFQVPEVSLDTFDFYYDAALPDGYAWIFPVGPQLVNVGVWSRRGTGQHRLLRRALAAFIAGAPAAELLRGGRELGAPRGAAIRPALSARLAGDHLLWVGESAGLLHRETGQGISYALESGRRAALVADRVLREGMYRADQLQAYDFWVRSSFERELLSWQRGK